MKKSLFIILSLIIIILSAEGCAPTKLITEERMISADRLIKKLEANRRKIKTFRGTGVLSVSSSVLNAKSNFEVILKKPDSIKVSFYGPFGIDLAHALITPDNFLFYDVINNNLYRGRMRDGIIRQVLKVDFSLDELVDALAGSVNLTDKLRKEPDNYDVDGDSYKLTYLDSDQNIEKIFTVRHDDLAISQNVMRNINGKVLLEGKYSRFRTFDDVPIPQEIYLNDLLNKQSIRVDYRRIEVNQNSISLKFEIPSDVKIVEW
ncbi:MAG: DUF4292 domain-containing protein [Melioribacteraceae bacterium]|nr:DUF4292 domain-containing protein [Melioribacteraceae bacterium]